MICLCVGIRCVPYSRYAYPKDVNKAVLHILVGTKLFATKRVHCFAPIKKENTQLNPMLPFNYAHTLFTEIAVKVKSKEMQGPSPKKDQVQGFIKRWRNKNRDDSMRPVGKMCAQFMFELTENITQTGDDLIVFCDSRRENRQLVPDLGDETDEYPFRMDLTSSSLIEFNKILDVPQFSTLIACRRYCLVVRLYKMSTFASAPRRLCPSVCHDRRGQGPTQGCVNHITIHNHIDLLISCNPAHQKDREKALSSESKVGFSSLQ
ncbi:hypothetical protein PHMEG_0007582 [Phytophthora megakarya]|uniref:Uncharacterized protein n=1 Tax=Phytophthora megakarya TaxID=4795 RepID=A0A225WMV1_9STRA|nr:hypothetical protein PHMEG_0007582 [Phytophthora megakarya]